MHLFASVRRVFENPLNVHYIRNTATIRFATNNTKLVPLESCLEFLDVVFVYLHVANLVPQCYLSCAV